MEKINTYLKIIKIDPKVKKQIFYITLGTALVVLALVIKGPEDQGKYIYNSSGELVGIQRESLNETEEYSVILTIPEENDVDERTIKLELKGDNEKQENEATDNEDKEIARETEIEELIRQIESSGKKRLFFPRSLSDGTKLSWGAQNKEGGSWVLIVSFYFILIILVIKSSIDGSQDELKRNRKEIMRSLPRFTNQLLLMMNAGMILSDAFEKICISYMMMDESDRGFFEKSIIQIYEKNADSRVSTAFLISEYATENSVKELMRISTILTENEKRGSDIIDNLSRESVYLWDERKIVARESGKLIDTKMSYPLGMLLILLIVITMAPALLTM